MAGAELQALLKRLLHFPGPAVRDQLNEPQYRVVIKSRSVPGWLKVGEWFLPGETEDCFVLAAHLDHPAQANDGLSGVVTGLAVMAELAKLPRRRCSYRLLITPETIGSVAWLSRHQDFIPQLKGGLFLDMTGLRQPPALQLSYTGDTQADQCLRHVHLAAEPDAWCAPYRGVVGNDERQFNAPGVRVPMLSYSRALPWGAPHRPYREYHSAADTPATVSEESLEQSKRTVLAMLEAWDANDFPRNLYKGEVFLAGYNLAVDRHRQPDAHRDMLRIMDCIDGTNSIVQIAERVQLPFAQVSRFVEQLRAAGLVEMSAETRFIRRGLRPATPVADPPAVCF